MLNKLLCKSIGLGLCLFAWPFLSPDSAVQAQKKQKAHAAGNVAANNQPMVAISAPVKEVRLAAACSPGSFPRPDWQPTEARVPISALAQDLDSDTLTYRYTASDGHITGSGPNAVWDLSGLAPGVYRANVYVTDGKSVENCDWLMVRVRQGECMSCATVKVQGPAEIITAGQPAMLSVMAGNAAPGAAYKWNLSAGRILSGQGTPHVMVDTSALGTQNVMATVSVQGLEAGCPATDAVFFMVAAKPVPTLFDSFGFTNMDDAKARLDALAAQLQQQPEARVMLAVSGTCEGEAPKQAARQRDYLVLQRGIEASRVQIADGGCRSSLQVELWMIPAGAEPPALNPAAVCAPCKAKRR